MGEVIIESMLIFPYILNAAEIFTGRQITNYTVNFYAFLIHKQQMGHPLAVVFIKDLAALFIIGIQFEADEIRF